MSKLNWVEVCMVDEIYVDDAIEFEHEGHIYGVFRVNDGFYCMDALCSHEQARLVEGYIHDNIVECPKHNAKFNLSSGKALTRPAKEALNTYETKIVEDKVYILI
jgi:3-phenylpropionate/trans-cinnamate dioxygenase ferredoxin subunit